MTIETGKVYKTKDGLRVVCQQAPEPGESGVYLFADPNGYQTFVQLADLTGPLTGVQAAVKGSVVVAPSGVELTVLGVCGDAVIVHQKENDEFPLLYSFDYLERRGYTLKDSAPADDGYAYRKDGTRIGKIVEREIDTGLWNSRGNIKETLLVIQPDETQ